MITVPRILLALVAWAVTCYSHAAKTYVHHFSGKQTAIENPITVVVPDKYDATKQYPSLYLLHGWSGKHDNWPKQSDVEKYADQYQLILVFPDGNYDSWYLNAQLTKQNYQDYITKDVVGFVDANYATANEPEMRGITGLSMGGFGALHIAINHPQLFSIAGSTSGGVDFSKFYQNWGIKYLVTEQQAAQLAIKHQLIVEQKQPPKMIIDVGLDDFFLDVNRELHLQLSQNAIPHTYIEHPGKHDWAYWRNAIDYQLVFFSKHFQRQTP